MEKLEYYKSKLIPSRKIKRKSILVKIINDDVPFWAYICPKEEKIKVGVCDYHIVAENQEKKAVEWASKNARMYNNVNGLPEEIKEILFLGYSFSNQQRLIVGKEAKEWFKKIVEELKK